MVIDYGIIFSQKTTEYIFKDQPTETRNAEAISAFQDFWNI